jgi:predicted dinucleotide-binding enzyme
VIFVSGDDGGAKAEVIAVFEDAGFAAIERGNLAKGSAKSAGVVAPSHAM